MVQSSTVSTSTDLQSFLSQYKVEKGQEYTHTSMGRPAGSYNIPAEAYDELCDHLYETIFVRGQPVHLTEKPPQETIVKADIDFRFPLDRATRQYTQDTLKDILKLYNTAISHYLDIEADQLKAFVFERKAPYTCQDLIKDGIHIMYPHIICDTKVQHLIREHVLINCGEVFAPLNCTNKPDDIVDKAIISSNNWLMYGCSKPNVKPYVLTHIYDEEFQDLPTKNYDNKGLIELLSIRNHDPEMSNMIKPDLKYLLEKAKPVVKKPTKVANITNLSKPPSDVNLEDVREVVKLLSVERSDNRKEWIKVGLSLRNTDESLLDAWIKFSQKSVKFQPGECERLWGDFGVKDDGLSISSLHRWARHDDDAGYAIYMRNSLQKDILKSQSQTTQDVAKVVFNMYRYQYKCTSFKYGTWYEFRNHRWQLIDSGITLRHKIGNQVVDQYLRLITYYNGSANEAQDEQKDQLIQKGKNLTDVTYKLRDYTFKDKIMKECQVMFHDPDFEEKLDSNPDLIGFENGVYDLDEGEFREGRPEDNISLSTGNEYRDYDLTTDETVQAIIAFMCQIFPDDDLREYVLILLASFLEGKNPNEKFHIWTGGGGNGKSKLLELFELAFGKYTSKIPVTVLTQKTKAGSSSANPEVARLKGIRAVSTQEPEENERFNVGIMKDWTGGDRITCRPLYREPFDFKPQFKMVFCCNHLPSLPPDDAGTWRRVRVVEFKARFVDNPDPNNEYEFVRDNKLTEKLHSWKEAFMSILIHSYRTYKTEGLIEPPAVLAATKEYQKVNDAYIEFISDCVQKDPESTIRLDDVFKRFKDWWKDNFGGKAPSRKDMKSSLEKKLGKFDIRGSGWVGYKLIHAGEDEDEDNEPVVAQGRISNALASD